MSMTKLALLGTLRELHASIPGYDWHRLEELVIAKKPDLLCVEIDRRSWEGDKLNSGPIEIREVLGRLSQTSEITMVPIAAGGRSWSESGVPLPRAVVFASIRKTISQMLNKATVCLMKVAGEPRAVNSPIVEHLCGLFCDLQVMLTDREGRRAWQAKNQEILEGVLWILRRDPGQRVLVALDCRRKHWLRRRLRTVSEVAIVDFWTF